MNKLIIALLLSSSAVPAFAQDTLQSGSASDANAASGSISGAQSNGNLQGQSQSGGNNAGIGSSTSESVSGAVSGSASESTSGSFSDQAQGQDQGQSQGQNANNAQSQGLTNANQLGQSATNQQGVTVNQAWNYAQPLRRTYVGTNAAVPLAASSSFSSDYCGGTASGGVSAAPIGISIGGAAPTFDKSCQSLRRAEKFGMAAANASNMGQRDLAGRLMAMMIWSICTSDSRGAKADADTAAACMQAGVLGSGASAQSYQPEPEYAPEPQTHDHNGSVTPEAATRAGERGASLSSVDSKALAAVK